MTGNSKRLDGKVAIITGGSSGIGKSTAIRFSQEGATIAIWDVEERKGLETIKVLLEMGFKAIFHKVDIADSTQVNEAVLAVKRDFGQIDILVNNAGIVRDSSLLKMTEEQFDSVIAVNLKGAFNCTKAVAPLMVERKYGRIIQAASIVALYGNFGQTNYVASKAGLIGMTKVWARELGKKGITVNAVAPGFIVTEMTETIPESILNEMKEKIPSTRTGTPEDIANAYLFLASDEAGYINGSVISVDGGATI